MRDYPSKENPSICAQSTPAHAAKQPTNPSTILCSACQIQRYGLTCDLFSQQLTKSTMLTLSFVFSSTCPSPPSQHYPNSKNNTHPSTYVPTANLSMHNPTLVGLNSATADGQPTGLPFNTI
eukprot:2606177-Ditylum_brightwellii.AAC.1